MHDLQSTTPAQLGEHAYMNTLSDRETRDEFLKLIRGWRWFYYVPEEAHEWLAERARIKHFAEGRILYLAGAPATHIYGVISGVFRIYVTSPRGHEITLEEVVAGGWFPHIVPAETPVYSADCICQHDSVVLSLPLPIVAEFSRRWPAYYRGLYHEFTDRAAVILGRIELLSLHNLNVRLAVYLLRMSRLRGQVEPSGTIWVRAFDSQSEVGARVGGTRQRVNGVLKAWVKKGLIELHKDGTRILDIAGLKREAEKSGFDVDNYLAGYHGGWQGHK